MFLEIYKQTHLFDIQFYFENINKTRQKGAGKYYNTTEERYH